MNPFLYSNGLRLLILETKKSQFSSFIKTHYEKLSQNHKQILKLFLKYTTPQTITRPSISYWINSYEKTKNINDLEHLFLELALILLPQLIETNHTLNFTTTNTLKSQHLQKELPPGEYTLSYKNNNIYANESELDLLSSNPFTYASFSLSNFQEKTTNLSIDKQYLKISNTEIQNTINEIIHTIIINNEPETTIIGEITLPNIQNPIEICEHIIKQTMNQEFQILKINKTFTQTTNKKFYCGLSNKPVTLEESLQFLHALLPLEEFHLGVIAKNNNLFSKKQLLTYFNIINELIIILEANKQDLTEDGITFLEYLEKAHQKAQPLHKEIKKQNLNIVKEIQEKYQKHREKIIKKYPNIVWQ